MDFGILLILIYTSLYLPGCLSGANAVPEDGACSSPVEGKQDLPCCYKQDCGQRAQDPDIYHRHPLMRRRCIR